MRSKALSMKQNFLARTVRFISNTLRRRRFQEFLLILQVKQSDTILDVGGYQRFWEGSGLEKNVTILNIRLPESQPKPYRWVEGDACQMDMFEDRSFDIVFSNSVIEHVGGFKKQQHMANEIQRVAKKYWVQTPYKHFPIETHFVFPFYQYLPSPLRIAIVKTWPFSFAKLLDLDPVFEAENIWLLGYREMHALFPDARILRERFCGLTKSLVAVRA